MGIRSLTSSSISTGAKRSKFWDQVTQPIVSDYQAIETVNATGQTTVTFNSGGVWANYKHLQLRFIAKTTRAAYNDSLIVRVNGDSTNGNYLREEVEWDHTAGIFYPSSGTSSAMVGGIPGNTAANYYGTGYVNIYDINSSKNKSFYITGCFAQGGTASGQNNWTIDNGSYIGSTNAITSLSLTATNAFTGYTQFALYGIKG